MPVQSDFVISETRGKFVGSIGTFLSLVPEDEYSVQRAIDMRREQLPEGLVPIAESGGSDYLCFDFRNVTIPKLCYWHHGRIGLVDEVTVVADSLTEFGSMLTEPGDDEELLD